MATLKGKAQQSTAIARQSEGNDVYLRALRDGSLIQADWKQAAVIAGFGFMVNQGSFSTGDTGGGVGNTVIENDGPDVCLSIPNGTSVLPLRIGVHVQPGTPGDAEETEILIAVDQDKEWPATGTASTGTIYNMNTLAANASKCTFRHTWTTTMTTGPVLDLELARKIVEMDVAAAGEVAMILDLVYEPKNPPIINGPAMLCVYWGGDTVCIGGFADVQWLEFPESAFTL